MGVQQIGDGDVLVSRDDRVVTVTFNRPDARNAVTLAMYEQIARTCQEITADDSVRVLLLQGAGEKAFAAGTDITEFAGASSAAQARAVEGASADAIRAVRDLPCVTLAALNGVAAGGGCAFALACDLRVASTSARVGVPIAATLGNALTPEMTRLLVDVVGVSLAREMLLAGKLVDVRRLESGGCVAWLAEPASLHERAAEFARHVASLSPVTQGATKRVLRGLAAGDDEQDALMAEVYGHADFHAAVAAFTGRGERSPFSAPRFSP